ncbi:MAG: insulinase family protein [Candidatus Obscuribacterales bacterium]|nr:insulinase family protein [Candidatus Obscuribacterales bacterium]
MKSKSKSSRVAGHWCKMLALLQTAAIFAASMQLPGFAVEQRTGHELTVAKSENGPQQYTLPNGLKIVLLEDHSFPVVSCFVWYRVGTRNESSGTTGISHIVEHLLFQTVGHYRKGELGATIARNGGQFNGFTSDDFTAFFETISPSKLDLALRIEADRMRGATFTQTDLQEEVARVKSEFEENNKDLSRTLTREVRAAAYVQHPYRNPPGGWESDLESISLHDAKDFYDRFFHPNNATLVIVGDFKTPLTLNAVSKYFGPIAKSASPIPQVKVVEQPQTGERRVMLHGASKKDELQVAYHAPAFQNVDAPAMMVLEKLLNASISGKLKVKLVDTKVCGSARSAFELKRDPSLFTLVFTAPAGSGPQKVLEGWDALSNQLRSQLITDAELKKAKNLAEFAISSERDGPYKFAFQLGYCDVLHSWQLGANWMERLRNVTANDLMRVSKKYLTVENRVVGQLAGNVKAAPVSSPATPKAFNPQSKLISSDEGFIGHVQLCGYKSDNASVVVPRSEANIDVLGASKYLRDQVIADIGEPGIDVAPASTPSGSQGAARAIWHKLRERINPNAGASTPPATATTSATQATSATTKTSTSQSVAPTVSAKSSASTSAHKDSVTTENQTTSSKEQTSADADKSSEGRFRHVFRRFKAPPAAGIPDAAAIPLKTDISVKVVPPQISAPPKAPARVAVPEPEKNAAAKPEVDSDKKTEAVGEKAAPGPSVSAVKTSASSESAPVEPAISPPVQAKVASPVTDAAPSTISADPTVSTKLNAAGVTPASVSRSALSLITKIPATILTLPGTPLANKPVPQITPTGPAVQRKVLKNGVTLIVLESHLSPMVQIEGAIKAGSVFEPAGKKGLSSLCAHIMSNGPGKLGRPQIMQQQEDLGLPLAAMLKFESGPETINFKTRCLSRDLSAQLGLLGASIKDPALQDTDIDKARSDFFWATKNAEDSIMTRVNRALLRSTLAPNTSYYPLDSAERMREVSLVKPSDIKDFVGQYVTPDATVIVIAGDISADRAFSMVEHSLEGWSNAQSKTPRVFPPATESARKLLKTSIPLADDKGKGAISFGRLIKMPSDQKDFSTLLITDCALNSHPIFSRLMQRFNSEAGLSENLSFEDLDSRFLPLSNMLSWSLTLPVESAMMPKSVLTVQGELNRFSRAGMTAEELLEVKRYLTAALPVKFMDSTSDAARNLLNGYFQDSSSNFLGDLIARVRNADLDTVNRFIRNDFKPGQAVLIVAGPAQALKQVSVQKNAASAPNSNVAIPTNSASPSADDN